MNCSSKHKDIYHTETCSDIATRKITVTTLVPHLNNQKKITVRCLCDFHAKRYRNKLNREITQMFKKKEYIEEII